MKVFVARLVFLRYHIQQRLDYFTNCLQAFWLLDISGRREADKELLNQLSHLGKLYWFVEISLLLLCDRFVVDCNLAEQPPHFLLRCLYHFFIAVVQHVSCFKNLPCPELRFILRQIFWRHVLLRYHPLWEIKVRFVCINEHLHISVTTNERGLVQHFACTLADCGTKPRNTFKQLFYILFQKVYTRLLKLLHSLKLRTVVCGKASHNLI